jgi:hypothetical protein
MNWLKGGGSHGRFFLVVSVYQMIILKSISGMQAGHQTRGGDQGHAASSEWPPTPVLQKHALILKFFTHYALVLFRRESMHCVPWTKEEMGGGLDTYPSCTRSTSPVPSHALRVLFFAYQFKRAYQNLWFCFGSTALLARIF